MPSVTSKKKKELIDDLMQKLHKISSLKGVFKIAERPITAKGYTQVNKKMYELKEKVYNSI